MKAETPANRLDRWVTQRFGSWYRFEQAAKIPHATATSWRAGTVPDPKWLRLLAEAGLDVHLLLTGTVPAGRQEAKPAVSDPLRRAIPYVDELPPVVRSALSDLLAREGVPADRATARAREVWQWVVAPLKAWRFDPALDPTGARQFPGLVDYLLAALGALRLSRQRSALSIVPRRRGPRS